LDSNRKFLQERTCSKRRKLNGFEAMIDLIKKKEGTNLTYILMPTFFNSATSHSTHSHASLGHFVVKGKSIPTVFRSVSSPN